MHSLDEELLQLIQLKNPLGLEKLYDKYASLTYNIAYKVTMSKESAEIVINKLFNEIWKSSGENLSISEHLSSSMIQETKKIAMVYGEKIG